MKKIFTLLTVLLASVTFAVSQAESKEESKMKTAAGEQRLMGGISPQNALDYMKRTPDIVIVEVNDARWKLRIGFEGAMWIPHTEMEKRFAEIPSGRPVIIHCGGGIVSVPAYNTLAEKRPDIPELSYIAGAPLVREYNEWLKSKDL